MKQNLWQKFVAWVMNLIKVIIAFIVETIEAALIKFSKINVVQYIGIGTLLLQTYFDKHLISESWLLIGTGVFTAIFNFAASTKPLVDSGFSKLGWTVYFSSAVAIIFGLVDMIFLDNNAVATMFPNNANLAMMIYLAVNIIFRTRFSNQTPSASA